MDQRYWIDDDPLIKPFGIDHSNFGIVDEVMGGIIAYTCSETVAKQLIEGLAK